MKRISLAPLRSLNHRLGALITAGATIGSLFSPETLLYRNFTPRDGCPRASRITS